MGRTHLHPLFQILLPPVLKDGTPRLLTAEIAVFEHLFVIDRLRRRRQIPWHHLHELNIYQLRTGTESQILAASGDVIRVQTVLEQSAQASGSHNQTFAGKRGQSSILRQGRRAAYPSVRHDKL